MNLESDQVGVVLLGQDSEIREKIEFIERKEWLIHQWEMTY